MSISSSSLSPALSLRVNQLESEVLAQLQAGQNDPVTDQLQQLSLEEPSDPKEAQVLTSTEIMKQRQEGLKPSIFAHIQEGHLSALQGLVQFPEDFQLKNQAGETLLIMAAKAGKPDVVSFLLEENQAVRQNPATAHQGLDLNAKDKNGDTALSHACAAGFKEVIALLVERKEVDVNVINQKGFTPLFRAYSFALQNKDDFEPLRLLLKREDLLINDLVILGENDINLTILWAACLLGRKDIVEDVLKHPKVEINKKDKDGCNALLHAYQAKFSPEITPEHEAIVQLLMQQEGIDLTAKVRGQLSLLMFAAMHGDEAMTRTLIEKQVFSNDPEHLMFAQMIAMQKGHQAVASLLI